MSLGGVIGQVWGDIYQTVSDSVTQVVLGTASQPKIDQSFSNTSAWLTSRLNRKCQKYFTSEQLFCDNACTNVARVNG